MGAAAQARFEPHEGTTPEFAGDHDVEQAVAGVGVRADPHAAAVAGAVADRDEHAGEAVVDAVDLQPVGPRAQPRHLQGDRQVVAARPARPRHPVGTLVDDGIEPGGEHGPEPSHVALSGGHPRKIDPVVPLVAQGGGDCLRGPQRIRGYAHSVREVIARAGGHHAEPDARPGHSLQRPMQRAVTTHRHHGAHALGDGLPARLLGVLGGARVEQPDRPPGRTEPFEDPGKQTAVPATPRPGVGQHRDVVCAAHSRRMYRLPGQVMSSKRLSSGNGFATGAGASTGSSPSMRSDTLTGTRSSSSGEVSSSSRSP